jgi:aspartate ammonia-lyase
MTRIEKDSLGTKAIPKAAYYGIHTQRASENFKISGQKMHPLLIQNMAKIKKAAAISHQRHHELADDKAAAIIAACQDIIAGNLADQFIIDAVQGGAGTSANMNVNEVIANRALELLGEHLGNYTIINPNDHVNRSQSTNDVFPTAGKMAILETLRQLETALARLSTALKHKSQEFHDVIKVGRTQLQDALPTSLGNSFKAFQSVIDREHKRIIAVKAELTTVNLGATAIGTSMNASPFYLDEVVQLLNADFFTPLQQADDLIDATQNLDGFMQVSSRLKGVATTISKIANDLRLMSSGPQSGLAEIHLPAKQVGSSIMPGKVNPVIPEVVSQAAFQVIGNDLTATFAVESGQLELNAFEPILFQNLLTSTELLTNAINTLTEHAIHDLQANKAHCYNTVMASDIMITALAPFISYAKAAALIKEARTSKRSVRELAFEKQVLPKAQLEELLSVNYFIEKTEQVAI